MLPADYVTAHVELAYASTVHGVQGDTVSAAHLVVGEHTGAASAYVGMTRGRQADTAHLVAADAEEAREQWLAVFARNRADLGPAHAAREAADEATRYAMPRPLDEVLAELRAACAVEQGCLDLLASQQLQHHILTQVVARRTDSAGWLALRETACRQTAADATAARRRAEASGALVAADAGRIRDDLLDRWDAEREGARQAAQMVLAGPGRLGFRRSAVARAGEQLTGWATRWAPHLPGLPTDQSRLTPAAARPDDRSEVWAALNRAARREAAATHPEHAALSAAADTTGHVHDRARHDVVRARRDHEADYSSPGQPDYASQLAEAERDLAAARQQLTEVQTRITALHAERAVLAQPAERFQQDNDTGRTRRDAAARTAATARPRATDRAVRHPRPEDLHDLQPRPVRGRGIGR